MLAAAPKGAWLMWADFDTVFAGRAFVPPLAQYAEERAHVVLSGQISEVLAGNGYSGSLASPQLKYYEIDSCIGTPPSARAANISSGKRGATSLQCADDKCAERLGALLVTMLCHGSCCQAGSGMGCRGGHGHNGATQHTLDARPIPKDPAHAGGPRHRQGGAQGLALQLLPSPEEHAQPINWHSITVLSC